MTCAKCVLAGLEVRGSGVAQGAYYAQQSRLWLRVGGKLGDVRRDAGQLCQTAREMLRKEGRRLHGCRLAHAEPADAADAVVHTVALGVRREHGFSHRGS